MNWRSPAFYSPLGRIIVYFHAEMGLQRHSSRHGHSLTQIVSSVIQLGSSVLCIQHAAHRHTRVAAKATSTTGSCRARSVHRRTRLVAVGDSRSCLVNLWLQRVLWRPSRAGYQPFVHVPFCLPTISVRNYHRDHILLSGLGRDWLAWRARFRRRRRPMGRGAPRLRTVSS